MEDEKFELDDSGLFSAIMENMADSIYFKDRQCRLVRVSKKMATSLGYSDPAELIGKTDDELFGKEFGATTRTDDLVVMETGTPIIGLVEANRNKNGETNWTSTTKLPIHNSAGKIIGLLGITREINELKKTELNLEFIATHDLLTTLPNRHLFFDRLDQAIHRSRRYHSSFAVLYIDLDHFKDINDQGGHDAGDEFLKKVADLFKHIIRDSDSVARIGGDEFAILLESIQSEKEAFAICERINAAFNDKSMLGVTASIGISIYPRHGEDASLLLRCADHAMYKAKKQMNTYRLFEFG
jgi:diguanylate cyclase (GGDEF)-like protein/PAS domain S-box-containing protein